jgi:phosphomethylpyrimidine synthase
MTQIEAARKGIVTKEIEHVARTEEVDVQELLENVAEGKVVILKNLLHDIAPLGVGKGLRTKTNANIGTSPERMDIEGEIRKLKIAEKYGVDTVMDLSLGAVLNTVRNRVMAESTVPVGTVPMYQMGFELSRARRRVEEMQIEDYLKCLEDQAKAGIDFVTVHAGLLKRSWDFVKTGIRITDVVSRGGSMLCVWMEKNNAENPLYTGYDKILEICNQYDVTISLGDGLRPGSTHDATDRPQIEELVTLGELGRRARNAGVQVMIEGPGHVPLDQVTANVQLEKRLCNDAPFYILGPLVTDIAPGYDHITSAIGGALAASAGADYLCYVTPAEHLSLPTEEDVKQGVIASRIAAHAGDMVKLGAKARKLDDEMSRARKKLDWDTMYRLSVDPETARRRRQESGISEKDYCSMCGEFCSVKNLNELGWEYKG